MLLWLGNVSSDNGLQILRNTFLCSRLHTSVKSSSWLVNTTSQCTALVKKKLTNKYCISHDRHNLLCRLYYCSFSYATYTNTRYDYTYTWTHLIGINKVLTMGLCVGVDVTCITLHLPNCQHWFGHTCGRRTYLTVFWKAIKQMGFTRSACTMHADLVNPICFAASQWLYSDPMLIQLIP